MQRLSHLAYIALGVICEEQPCTGYAVMRSFRQSASSYFSGSAGAIYPLLRRLEKAHLIEAKRTRAGSRTRKHYSVTSGGKRQFKKWLSAPLPDEDVSFTVDLLRTRVIFFDFLTKGQRSKLGAHARKKVLARIEERQASLEEASEANRFQCMAMKSALIAETARLEWLDMIEDELAE